MLLRTLLCITSLFFISCKHSSQESKPKIVNGFIVDEHSEAALKESVEKFYQDIVLKDNIQTISKNSDDLLNLVDSVIHIAFYDKDKNAKTCSGVYISDSVILTAAHCIPGKVNSDGLVSENIYVVGKGLASTYAMRHPKFDFNSNITFYDVGVIFTPKQTASIFTPHAKEGDSKPSIGEHVLLAGYGSNDENSKPTLRIGHNKINQVEQLEYIISKWISLRKKAPGVDVIAQKGDSGGPLFYKNKVIGVCASLSGLVQKKIHYVDIREPTIQSFINESFEKNPF